MKLKTKFLALSGLTVLLIFFLTGAVALQAQSDSVFINEIHYDNSGTDTGEAVELAGPAGEDLSGWSLVLYNGNGGAAYNTVALGGLIPDQDNGYGTLDFAIPGIQNGSPDGLALVDPGSAVVQFLSYEGTFAAVGGPADGMTSTDIGVVEGSSTNVGESLQLTGVGTAYEDFTWATPLPNTFGAVNAGQSFSEPPPPIVINEIMQNPSAVFDSAGEWFELYNAGTSDVDIEGWTIRDDDSDIHVISSGGPLLIPAEGYLVLGNNADFATNGGVNVDYSYGDGWFLSNSADEVVLLDSTGAEVDRVNYDGGPDFPDPNGASMSLIDPALNNNAGENWCTSGTSFGDGDLGSPGAANVCHIEACGDPFTPIYEVQGSGDSSPLVGTNQSIEGVVVGDFQDDGDPVNSELNGFHVQDPLGDGDAATSDGIFVYAPGSPEVNVGDAVRVRGSVSEYFGLTEISADEIWICSSGHNVAPTPLSLPVSDVGDFEAFEGMLVTFPQELVISEYFNFDRFNEIVLTSERHFQPTSTFEPGSAEAAQAEADYQLDRITLDDGRTNQNPDPARHPNGLDFDLTNLFRGGDTVKDVTGVIDYSFSLYRIQPTQGATHTNVNVRPLAPEDVGGNIKVAAFNVLNYFTTLDNSGPICGPDADQGCRGADNAEEFTRQRDKIIAALAEIDADVVGLMEIENHATDYPTADLVSGLNDVMGAGTYDYIPTGATGGDAIRVAIIYKPASVTPDGAVAVLDDASFVDPLNTGIDRNRPAVAQTFIDNGNGATFTAVVNHFKSKSGSELDDSGAVCVDGDPTNDVPDCDQGDGQAYFNATRTATAQALADWLATDPTGSGDPDILIIGDLNSYDKEDPIDVLTAAGYSDLLYDLVGENAYTYLFDGRIGYLDYGMASDSLASQVTGVTAWNINADEPDIIDYDTSFKKPAQDAIYAPDQYRASDHDPVIVGLDLNGPPVCKLASPSIEEIWPVNHQFVAVSILGVTDPEGDPISITIDAIWQDEPLNMQGDGNFAPDGDGVGTDTAYLRAERDGRSDGRAYHIFFTADDGNNNSCSESVVVYVPKSQGKYGERTDDGPLYDSTLP